MLGDNVAAAKRPMQRRDGASTEKLDIRTSRRAKPHRRSSSSPSYQCQYIRGQKHFSDAALRAANSALISNAHERVLVRNKSQLENYPKDVPAGFPGVGQAWEAGQSFDGSSTTSASYLVEVTSTHASGSSSSRRRMLWEGGCSCGAYVFALPLYQAGGNFQHSQCIQ